MRETRAVGEAGLGQQRLRLGDVLAEGGAGVVAGDVGREHDLGGGELALEDLVGQRRPVDRQRQRLADLHVVGRRVGRVAGDEAGAGAGEDLQQGAQRRVGLGAVEVGAADLGLVQLVVLEGDEGLGHRVGRRV